MVLSASLFNSTYNKFAFTPHFLQLSTEVGHEFCRNICLFILILFDCLFYMFCEECSYHVLYNIPFKINKINDFIQCVVVLLMRDSEMFKNAFRMDYWICLNMEMIFFTDIHFSLRNGQ